MDSFATVRDFLIRSPMAHQWERIGVKHHHGINVPLFSLHTKQSAGIGEYLDLLPLLDWCRTIGFDVIQLLPLNDTGPDSSPYSAISAFALNPIHLSVSALPNITSYPILENQIVTLQAMRNMPRVNYHLVREGKYEILKGYFSYEYKNLSALPEYNQFVNSNFWLWGYALFKVLKEHYRWVSWREWSAEHQHPTEGTLSAMIAQFRNEVEFHIFLQFLCYTQLTTVFKEATKRGVFLKGDIPILLSPESADVWRDPNLFRLNLTAGAPPDMYATEGQNWGSPIYDWEELERTQFAWWKQRLHVAEHYYHLCRLDHIIGFFRIWAIPPGLSGRYGHYIPHDSSLWLPHGDKVIRMIAETTRMLPIGEDLGDVPPFVTAYLANVGVCGTKVMRWVRSPDFPHYFADPKTYSPISMTTVSTHDSETLGMWWREQPHEARAYAKMRHWEMSDDLTKGQLDAILRESHSSSSLFHINLLQEYLSLFPEFRWADTSVERVNTPGTISEMNWTSRYKPSIEEIIQHQGLMESMLSYSHLN
jgi:4-alpha-glucanotransferase